MDIGVHFSGLGLIGLILMLQVVLFLVAMVLGCWSLLLLCRPSNPKRGLRLAIIAVVLGILAEAGSFWVYSPAHSPKMGLAKYLLLLPLQTGLCGVVFWGLAETRWISGTGRLAIAVAAIGLAMGAVLGIYRWERRRVLLNWAAVWAERAREAEAASRKPGSMADWHLRFGQHSAATSQAFRWAADHPSEEVPAVPTPDFGP